MASVNQIELVRLVFHNLLLANQRSLVVPERDLVSYAVCAIVQHGINRAFHQLAAR